MAILVTGGAGFIGSHTCVELLNAGEDIVVMDNFYNSNSRALDGIRKITGKDFKFYEDDMLDIAAVDQIFAENDIEQVIHFAGYKCVPESVQKPLMYYSNNLRGTFNILETMKKYGCTKFVFSSSATVYGIPATVPVKEDFPLSAINPYGSTKLIIENLCREMYAADNTWTMILLRYFNPVGAHESGLIGEDPNGIPNNLMPIVLDKATGKRDVLAVAGNDYPTPDWYLRARLYPRCRPRKGSRCRSKEGAQDHRRTRLQPRNRPRIFCSGYPEHIPAREQYRSGIHHRPAPSRRRCDYIRRPLTRGEGARLEG